MLRFFDSQIVIRNALASIGSGISARLSTVFGLLDTKITTMDATITANVLPSGVILPYGGTSAPTGFLMCDGSSKLRATYPALFAVIGTAFGAADGTHFNLPPRGMFLRGVNGGSGNDPDASSRTAVAAGGNTGDNVGSKQVDQIKSHNHQVYAVGNAGGGSAIGLNTTFNFNSSAPAGYTAGSPSPITDGAGGGNQTNPVNVAVNHIIKI